MKANVSLAGKGLFTGQNAVVSLARSPGPVRFRVGDREHALGALEPRARGRTSALFAGDTPVVSCAEHLFAAIGALGVGRDLVIETSHEELPLLDGGAVAWAEALLALFGRGSTAPSPLVVVRAGVVCVGPTEVRFAPHEGRRVEVHFESAHPCIVHDAVWSGDVDDFMSRIAPARTFVEERELAAMAAAGKSATADPESVVVLGESTVHAAGRPFSPDEPARHKLLDLIGDLALHGGPPRGSVTARRPGHAATHAVMARALEGGLVVRGP